jgi:hypothetical protein
VNKNQTFHYVTYYKIKYYWQDEIAKRFCVQEIQAVYGLMKSLSKWMYSNSTRRMKTLMSDITVTCVTKYGRINAVKIMVAVRGNLVSIDSGTTSQPLIRRLISITGGTAEQALWYSPHFRPSENRGKH